MNRGMAGRKARATLQISQCQEDRLFAPRFLELALELLQAVLLVLRLQRFDQAKQHAPVARAAAERFAEDLLALGSAIGADQRGAERFTSQIIPIRWFIVAERVLNLDGLAPVSKLLVVIRGRAGGKNLGGDGQNVLRFALSPT